MFTADGLITKPSPYSVSETLDRLETLLLAKDVTIFARIDHASEAARVGLSMPPLATLMSDSPGGAAWPGWGTVTVHVLLVTILSNVGKMFPAFCYRSEATLRQRLAVAIGMWPRGEVGAGVLVVSLSYGVGGVPLMVGALSLALNLLLTGAIVAAVKRLAN